MVDSIRVTYIGGSFTIDDKVTTKDDAKKLIKKLIDDNMLRKNQIAYIHKFKNIVYINDEQHFLK